MIYLRLFSYFILIFSNRLDLGYLIELNYNFHLLKVYDGDTVLIQFGPFREKLRLSIIDAPEMGQPFLFGAGDAGLNSKKCLIKILSAKKSLSFSYIGRDIYGRLLGRVPSVDRNLLEEGCVGLYSYAEFRNRREKFEYLKIYFKTMNKRNFLAPYLWRKLKRSQIVKNR